MEPPVLTGLQTLSAAMVDALGDVATSLLGAIGTILPIVIPIFGGVALIMLGKKVFKKFLG